MDVFPAYQPSYSATKKSDPIVRASSIGGTYQQRTRFGINQNKKEWSLSFNLSEDDANIVEEFLDAHAYGVSFAWAPPDESYYYKWVCLSWNREFFDLDRSLITATFRQVFDLGVTEPPNEPEVIEDDDYYSNMATELYSWKYPFYLDWWGN